MVSMHDESCSSKVLCETPAIFKTTLDPLGPNRYRPAYSFETVLLSRFATQMLAPSKAAA